MGAGLANFLPLMWARGQGGQKGQIRPKNSYHAPKATQKHMAEISSNHGHTFPSQYCAFKATQIVVVQKIASNPWRNVEKGKKGSSGKGHV